MKHKKAFWACSLVLPASIAPLAITSCGCSQTWGFKTPISIGTNIKGGEYDPYKNFYGDISLVDLDGNAIVEQLQSNYAIDLAKSSYYGYSLPQKWNSEIENAAEGNTKWNKGNFENGSASWLDYSSSDFVKSNSISGTWEKDGTTKNVSKTIYSYRNNTLASNIELVALIGTTINQYLNYALQYQGTQLGTEYASEETNTNLGIAWGGAGLTHGKIDGTDEEKTVNRQFMESIFASNSVSGTGKSKAILHPTQVEFAFKDGFFPIVAYKKADGKITGVNDETLTLLNGEAAIPSSAKKQYYSAVSDEQKESIFNHTTGATEEYKYKVYTYTNVPVVVSMSSFVKSYVNPTINNSFMVSDFYSGATDINDAIGDSWKDSLSKFVDESQEMKPLYRKFTYNSNSSSYAIEPLSEGSVSGLDKFDGRINTNLKHNDFVALINYSYKEYTSVPSSAGDARAYDRVTMTGLSTVFPAYICDKSLGLADETTFFTAANSIQVEASKKGYIFDTNKVNKYCNSFLEVLKRTTGQGLIPHATDLNDTSKKLLRFLGYMFGDNDLKVDTKSILTTTGINE